MASSAAPGARAQIGSPFGGASDVVQRVEPGLWFPRIVLFTSFPGQYGAFWQQSA